MKKFKSAMTKGVIIFIIISLGVLVGILIRTTDSDTWSHLLQFRWQYIPVIFGFGTIRWVLDAMSFVTMAKHGSKTSLSLKRAAAIRLEGTTAASVGPVLLGAMTLHAYLLHREKLSLSESMAITVMRSVLPFFIFLANIPILIFLRNDPMGGEIFVQLLKAISLPIVLIIVFFIYMLFFPGKIKRLISRVMHWWGRIKFIHSERIEQAENRVHHQIDQFSQTFWHYLKERKTMLLKATGWIFLAFIADYFMAMAIIAGFGVQPDILKGLLFQSLMRPIIFLAPTPGGTGIWEFTYMGYFSLELPNYLIGVAVLIWRIMLTYIPSIVGGIILIKDFRRDAKLKTALTERGRLEEDELDDDENGAQGSGKKGKK